MGLSPPQSEDDETEDLPLGGARTVHHNQDIPVVDLTLGGEMEVAVPVKTEEVDEDEDDVSSISRRNGARRNAKRACRDDGYHYWQLAEKEGGRRRQ